MYIFLKFNKIIVLLKKYFFYTPLYLEVQTNFIKQINLARAVNTLFIIVQDTTKHCFVIGQLGGRKPYPYPVQRHIPCRPCKVASTPPPEKFSYFKNWPLQKLKVACNRIQKETAVLALILYSNSCNGLGGLDTSPCSSSLKISINAPKFETLPLAPKDSYRTIPHACVQVIGWAIWWP